MLPLLCSISLILSTLMLSRSFSSNFGLGPFPKIAGKSPAVVLLLLIHSFIVAHVVCLVFVFGPCLFRQSVLRIISGSAIIRQSELVVILLPCGC